MKQRERERERGPKVQAASGRSDGWSDQIWHADARRPVAIWHTAALSIVIW